MKIRLESSVQHPSGKFKVVWNPINNFEVFKNVDWSESKHDSNVYIWVDESIEQANNLPFGINNIIKHKIIYIGRQSTFNPDRLFSNRCVTHQDDALTNYINLNKTCVCHVIGCGMTVSESKSLEAKLIFEQWFKKPNLLNKRRETSWEKKSYQYLR